MVLFVCLNQGCTIYPRGYAPYLLAAARGLGDTVDGDGLLSPGQDVAEGRVDAEHSEHQA